jgi:hypothetical protein
VELEDDEVPPSLEDSTSSRAVWVALESAEEVFPAKSHCIPLWVSFLWLLGRRILGNASF